MFSCEKTGLKGDSFESLISKMQNRILELENEKSNIVGGYFTREDVKTYLNNEDHKYLDKVINHLDKNFNAEFGLCWSDIDCALHVIKCEKRG